MVKSYQGVRKEEEKDYTPALVKDYMTKQLITFSPKQTVNEVVDVLVYRNISGGPVINEDGQLIGIISEGDCLKEIMRGHYNNDLTMSALVEEVMVKSVITVAANDTVWDVASKFLEMKLRRFPVLNEDKLVGQISQRDIMKAVEELN
ncbi:MAG: inosine-5-monophosphate dehydrogenase [Flavobacteriales bacterium]|nr:inosine-5-monophosphate dehydrogenase [Flavobacteriales bacterium]|tara:strand:- start:31340 stop:31783 length:444 start_codon:yes stop_codon:yes gene_type:complete